MNEKKKTKQIQSRIQVYDIVHNKFYVCIDYKQCAPGLNHGRLTQASYT